MLHNEQSAPHKGLGFSGQMESDAYESTVQIAQVGSKNCVKPAFSLTWAFLKDSVQLLLVGWPMSTKGLC